MSAMLNINPVIAKGILSIQEQIFNETRARTDAHYEEGKGVLFVLEGQPLIERNVIYAADEMFLMMKGM